MQLSDNQRRFLRGRAHALKPLVQIGGVALTDGVARETERALEDHELIKVRARGAERLARAALFSELARRTGSAIVQQIGHIAVLYRRHPKLAKIVIPDA